ncbi:MAG: molybdopterin converting factor subunit 1 [Pseudohongiellaceae bacterium]
MLRILFFASLREQLGTDRMELALPGEVDNVEALAGHLAGEGGDAWQVLLEDGQVLVAVDQTIVDRRHPLEGDEEVAFFPPVTGG